MTEKLMEPRLECVHPVLMSRDVDNAIRFYEKLGFVLVGQDTPVMPRYARMRRDGVELHFQWHDAKEWDYPNESTNLPFCSSRCRRNLCAIPGKWRACRRQTCNRNAVGHSGVP